LPPATRYHRTTPPRTPRRTRSAPTSTARSNPEVCIINGVLHNMTAAAAQALGVVMEVCDEDEEEEEDDEEDE